MMRSMRAMAPWLMLIIAVSFVGWMVFEVGMDIQGQTSGGVYNDIIQVNGRTITLETYNQAVRNAQEMQRQPGGGSIETLEDQRSLEDAVAEQLIQQVLLEQEYRRRNIVVTDDEIREALLNIPLPEIQQIEAFQTEGQFDLTKYQRYLTSGADPNFVLALEERYRSELPLSKFVGQVTQDVRVSEARVRQAYHDRYDSVTADVVAIVPTVIVSDAEIEVTDDDLRRYYREHRDEFKRPAVAYTSYVELVKVPDAADTAAALARVRALRAEIAAGADFAAVASRESADSASRVQGGDLGERNRGDFVPEFEQAALALRPGQVSEPVLSSFGYHLIKLESRTGDRFRARHILVAIELQGEHLERVDALADSLDLIAAESDDPTALDTVGARLGLPVLPAAPVQQGERVRAGGLPVPDAGIWAFEASVGQTSPVVESDWAYFVFRLDSLKAERVPPLADVRADVERAVRREKKLERARTIAAEVASEIREGSTLGAAAQRHNLTVRSIGPFTRTRPSPVLQEAPEAAGAAFGLPLGKAGGPYQTELGIFFVQPTARWIADSAGFAERQATIRAELVQQAQQARIQQIVAALRKDARIVDRREEMAKASRALADEPLIPGSLPIGR
jgi:peptidyl-prolyl cis-trans isomerase D